MKTYTRTFNEEQWNIILAGLDILETNIVTSNAQMEALNQLHGVDVERTSLIQGASEVIEDIKVINSEIESILTMKDHNQSFLKRKQQYKKNKG